MKRFLFFLSAALSVLILSCNKNEDVFEDDWLKVEANLPGDLKTQSALLRGRIEAGKNYKDWEYGFCVKGSINGSPDYAFATKFRDFPVQGSGDISLQLNGLRAGGRYAFYVYARKDGHEETSETVEFYTYTNDGYEMEAVDLGLSVQWAVKNLGAITSGDAGTYFAWGETSPKASYTAESHSYKQNPDILPRTADAASAQLGGNWRMPTKREFEQLLEKCDCEYTTLNGELYGIAFKGRGRYKEKWIFFPFCGRYEGSELKYYNEFGDYYSSEIRGLEYSYGLYVSYPLMENISSYIGVSPNCYQSYGCNIRAVKSK